MKRLLRHVAHALSAADPHAPDVVIDRQLRELKQQFPRELIGVSICSALVYLRFLEAAPIFVLASLGLLLAIVMIGLPHWAFLNIDKKTPAQKRRSLNSIFPIIYCICIQNIISTLYLSPFATEKDFILLAILALIVGVGTAMAIASLREKSSIPMILCVVPLAARLLLSNDGTLTTIAVTMITATIVVHYYNTRSGNALRELSLHLLALDHFCWAAKAQRARTDPLAYSAATVANRQRTHLTASHLHRRLRTGSRRHATGLKS